MTMKYVLGLSIMMTFVFNIAFQDRKETFSSESVAVVELFTSQGCSSCPAADALLGEMVTESKKEGKPILGLSYHVSYWNHLGWKDPYSSEQFTLRQQHYAEVLQLQSIYTPQMIVNGEYEFVGSDRRKLENALTKVRSEIPEYEIEANATLVGKEVVIRFKLNHGPKNEFLNIALVESQVQNEVLRGENQGRTLIHYNVVRKLETLTASQSGEAKLTIPEKLEIGKCSIVLYVQDRNSLKVLGAERVGLR